MGKMLSKHRKITMVWIIFIQIIQNIIIISFKNLVI